MTKQQRDRYHPIFFQVLARVCKEQAGWKCEWCGIAEGTWRLGLHRRYKEVIQAAHIDHDPWNPNARLMALCQACHLRHDAAENGRKSRNTRYQKRRSIEMAAGQLNMFAENDEVVLR